MPGEISPLMLILAEMISPMAYVDAADSALRKISATPKKDRIVSIFHDDESLSLLQQMVADGDEQNLRKLRKFLEHCSHEEAMTFATGLFLTLRIPPEQKPAIFEALLNSGYSLLVREDDCAKRIAQMLIELQPSDPRLVLERALQVALFNGLSPKK